MTDATTYEPLIPKTVPRYWYALTNNTGTVTTFRYPTFRDARLAGKRNGVKQIYFTDPSGREHKCEHITGQERFDDD